MHQVLDRLDIGLSSTENLHAFNINPASPLANRIRCAASVCDKSYPRPNHSCCTHWTWLVRTNLNLPRTRGHMVKQYLEGVREGNGRHEEEVHEGIQARSGTDAGGGNQDSTRD